jgi:amidase
VPDAADLMFRPVDELAGSIRSGELSSREVVQASLDRIEELNPRLNAFVDVFAEEALAAADAVVSGDCRPFAGVPIAIKNNRGVAGKRLTLGSDFTGDFLAPMDHNTVRRLRGAGFVVIGTTTLPEWGITPVSQARRFGATNNPWDVERTPGGSSGGSAAAVASGMVPVAHGNDGGGSTRIPAACCGLVGLKPQRGRISLAPEAGDSFLVCDGVLTRTVGETAQLLDVLAGYEAGDATWAPPPREPFTQTAARAPDRLRIAFATAPPLVDASLDPDCERVAREAAALLESLGHEVVEAEPPWHGNPEMLSLFTASFGPAVCTQIAFFELVNGRPVTEEDMEPLSWALWQVSQGITSVQAAGAEFQLQGLARAVVAWMSQYDALLTPALAEPPVHHDVVDPCAVDPMASFARSGRFTPYTALFNVTGQPAISLPLSQREDGLPIGVQLVGQPAREGDLLALAAQVEAARPWAGRRPPVS